MGAIVALLFNMCMVYIWVGVYNIVFEWNGDFVNVVNIVMDLFIICEVVFECQISMEMDVSMVDRYVW